jgi:sulfhydrogenase subunit beta (sulfur reductase)
MGGFPMKGKIIEKSELSTLIGDLTKEYEIFVPVKEKNLVAFERLSPGNEAHLDFRNTKKAPKEIFLPQTEALFSYRTEDKDVEIVEPSDAKARKVLLGVRPCDCRSFVLLDKFLSSGEYRDVYYLEKRGNTTIFGMACDRPLSTCFCTSVGGSPFGREGVDLLIQEIDNKYLIEIVTERGEELIKKFSWLKDAEKADIDRAKKLAEDAENAMKQKFSVNHVSQKLDKMFDDPFWDQIFQKCLGCGVCAFLCPTCCCFDILDEEGKRIRIWDSCQFTCFTLQGSGHNPRPSGKERMRQRIMHKFNYFVKNHGESFCVGCGRCVQECPVNLDIREVIGKISTKQEKKNG